MEQQPFSWDRLQKAKELLFHLFLIFIIFVILLPILYILLISFSPVSSLQGPVELQQFSLEHWKYILGLPYFDPLKNTTQVSNFPILRWLFNGFKVAGITSVLMLILSTTAAYALSRFDFRGKKTTLLSLTLIQLFPNLMAMMAFYQMLHILGDVIPFLGLDTHGGLILIYLGGTPFNIWLIKGHFDSLPRSIEEQATLDGLSNFQTFLKIVLPMSTPILAVVGLLTFIGTFADFIGPSIILKSQDKLTFSVGIQRFVADNYAGRYGPFAASSLLGALPIVLIFLSIHRYIVSGLTAGSVKG